MNKVLKINNCSIHIFNMQRVIKIYIKSQNKKKPLSLDVDKGILMYDMYKCNYDDNIIADI